MNTFPDDQPWWLWAEQRCAICLQSHALGVEGRCQHCGTIVCAFCIVSSVEVAAICPDCATDDTTREP